MKKLFYIFLIFSFFCMNTYGEYVCKNTDDNQNDDELQKCILEDDEYCVYNQCYFDKIYRKMKNEINLTSRQEKCIDDMYRSFKYDMEKAYYDYKNYKDNILKRLVCENGCINQYKKDLRIIKKESKEKYRDFIEDIEEILSKKQRIVFKKFQRNEKKKLKKIYKYSLVYKLPCVNCYK